MHKYPVRQEAHDAEHARAEQPGQHGGEHELADEQRWQRAAPPQRGGQAGRLDYEQNQVVSEVVIHSGNIRIRDELSMMDIVDLSSSVVAFSTAALSDGRSSGTSIAVISFFRPVVG